MFFSPESSKTSLQGRGHGRLGASTFHFSRERTVGTTFHFRISDPALLSKTKTQDPL
jgi:hypothetical protein